MAMPIRFRLLLKRPETECVSCTGLLPAVARRSRDASTTHRFCNSVAGLVPRTAVPQPRQGNATRLLHHVGLGPTDMLLLKSVCVAHISEDTCAARNRSVDGASPRPYRSGDSHLGNKNDMLPFTFIPHFFLFVLGPSWSSPFKKKRVASGKQKETGR
jgi:hypothetical protein